MLSPIPLVPPVTTTVLLVSSITLAYLHTSSDLCNYRAVATPRSQPVQGSFDLEPIRRSTSRERTSDLVLQQLQDAIRDLRLAPGTELSESALSQRFGVSRTPVREALAKLVDAGLVHVTPQVGTRVARIRPDDVRQAQFVREHLELGAFEAACARTDLSTERLHHLLDEQREAYDDGNDELFFASDEALHRTIFELARYPGVWDVVQGHKLQLDRLRRLALPDRSTTRELIAEHAQIVEALDNSDVPGGRDITCKHLRRALTYLPRLRDTHPTFFTDQ
uniref:Putative transcriptional regulator n=1 Tax=Mycolicibacterium brisbanense TaxID=146020 RepID=B8R4I3_9MYCO|nr:putative transcriptional regulator [Mycolicibacterium brisbanense]